MKNLSPSGCTVCGSLHAVETSFCKYGSPALDRLLPAAASRLVQVRILDAEAPEKRHARRCPACSSLFVYRLTSEYQINGAEDEETLTRLSAADAAAFLRREAKRLESLRQEADRLWIEAGRLADFLNRGHPGPAEEREAAERRERLEREAYAARQRLSGQVAAFRETCPEIVSIWVSAHVRVLEAILARGFPPGPDASTDRFAAQEALRAWRAIPDGSEAFISSETRRFPDYEDRLEAELGA